MKRSTTILTAVLVLLAAAAVWVMQRPGEQSVSTASGERLVTIDSAAVDAIEVRGRNGAVRLERRGMEWFVAEPVQARANAASVAAAIGQAGTLRVKSVVSAKREKHGLFQVDSSGGTTVRMYAGGALQAAFVVGKPSDGYSDTYVREASSDEVALVGGSFGWTFDRAVRDWRDRSILALARGDIREIRYQYGDTVFVVAMTDSVWRVDGRPANASAVEAVVTALTSFQADDFAEAVPTAPMGASVTVAGQQLRFTRDANGSRWLVQTSAGPQVYVVEPWRADQLLKRRKDLL